MAGVGPITQDWEPVVIRRKAPNAAHRASAEAETIKKVLSRMVFPRADSSRFRSLAVLMDQLLAGHHQDVAAASSIVSFGNTFRLRRSVSFLV